MDGGGRSLEHCHVNDRWAQWVTPTPFQATAVASSHALKASVRNRLNVDILSK